MTSFLDAKSVSMSERVDLLHVDFQGKLNEILTLDKIANNHWPNLEVLSKS
jgi:hypothetical protein